MASILTDRELSLLDANLVTVVGQKPYEDGIWGSNPARDFVHFQIFDANENLIQYENLPISEFIVNSSINKVEFYPGNHLRRYGFQSGTFTLRYNFLRKLAGDESSVLVHTIDKNDTKIGDVYTNVSNIYITEDGLIYAGTEEEYQQNPTAAEQLKIEDLKYQIDEVSPSRTEIRLRAKNINTPYIDDFVNIQTPYTIQDVEVQLNFADNSYETNELTIAPNENDFIFTQQMVDGTITIPDVYKVDVIVVPSRTEINVIQNPSGEEVEVDNLGNVLDISNEHEWDATLHDDAVQAVNWSSGFLQFSSGDYDGTSAVGYHAKWVQREGIAGGNCIKFTDQNEVFSELDVWPNASAYRTLAISQEIPSITSQGAGRGDFVNIRMDVKSTIANKGVQVALHYADELLNEEQPTNPPPGYFDPENPGPTEPIPTEPPDGYVENSISAATAVEPSPSGNQFALLAQYGVDNVPNPLDLVEGSDTSAVFGGQGAWLLTNILGSGISTEYVWSPNVGNPLDGETSQEGQWIWNGGGGFWYADPNIANSFTPPDGTTGKLNSINYHPSHDLEEGHAYYPRTNYRGENHGWQTMTVVGNDAECLLFKDDLIWKQKHDRADTNKLELYQFDEYFAGLRDTNITHDGVTKSLYDDIFQNGYIQSVTRVCEGRNDGIRSSFYLIFYNNGDKNDIGEMDELSNRFFYIHRTEGPKAYQRNNSGGNEVLHFLRDFNGGINDNVIANGGEMEWFYKYDDGYVRYYIFVGDEYYAHNEGDNAGNNGGLYDNDVEGPTSVQTGFPNDYGVTPVAVVGKVGGFGRYRYIIEQNNESRQLRAKSSAGNGTDHDWPIGDAFYRCGEAGTGGVDLTYGVRNPAAENQGLFDGDQGSGDLIDTPGFSNPFSGMPVVDMSNAWKYIIYDNNQAVFAFPENPRQIGALSPLELWTWNGEQWIDNALSPPRYNYISPDFVKSLVIPSTPNVWENIEVSIEIPQNWLTEQKWFLWIYGDGNSTGNLNQGVVWVDNIFMDFTIEGQSVTKEVFRPYTAQITSVNGDGLGISVNKTFRDKALEVGVDDENPSTVDVYDISNPGAFPAFSVSYLNFNPKDLRTYLKFDNELFLTTNFKQDKIGLPDFPYSVIYKLYEPLPDNYQKFDECIVVKEMANPLQEVVNVVDFVPAEEPRLVLKSPDLNNVESAVQRRQTKYKSESDILTEDATISNELRNEYLSSSLDSVEINTDYSRYENFINFSSIEKRIRNFKLKLENIEEYQTISSSYVGVSGSNSDLKLYHSKIEDVKNNLDGFEKYMYFESSSYSSGSLGIFYDNSWPKTSGDGTLTNRYVLAGTTSATAKVWFDNAVTSASIYDLENNSKLSSLLPEFIKYDDSNSEYLSFTDMIGQHFDHIWEHIRALSDTYDRRDKLDEGLSKELLWNVAKSLGWNLNDGKDLIELPRFTTGKEVSGSAFSDYSSISERDISREIWGRIVNNMPFFLKNKGTVKALKGLINIYGIPSTILRVKEFGGPNLPDDETPQFEITRKFTKALDFRGEQFVKTSWVNDDGSSRKPDTVEFRFRAATGSNQILVQKEDKTTDRHWYIRLKDNGSSDNYGSVSFMLSGSAVGLDQGQYKEIVTDELPVYDGDFYSVMVRRMVASDTPTVSQSYELHVGKYDAGRSKIHLYKKTTMDVTQAASSSFNLAWTGSGEIYVGGKEAVTDVGARFSGSIMEYRHWTETLNSSSFKNHIGNPKAYDGNTISSSYENLVLRYSFDDNKNLAADTEGIRDVSSNQTQTLSGSHSGFSGNFFSNVVDEQKTHIPSIGALRRVTNKIRIEDNPIKPGSTLRHDQRATNSAYDTAPTDSNKVGIWFAPTDVINNDIINSVANLNFDNFLGDPRDKVKLNYRGLSYVADNYWKKYTAPNNFWDYIRMLKYYDQSLYPQLRKLVPARAKPDIGLLIEPNIFERPKIVKGKEPTIENRSYTSSIDLGSEVDGLIVITGSYNHGHVITNYDAYTGKVNVFSYETGSSVVSASGENLLLEASGSEFNKRAYELSIWQRLGTGNYITSSITTGDVKYNEVEQPVITGSRMYYRNQKIMNFYTSSDDAVYERANSSSFYHVDLDNTFSISLGLTNSFYGGVKNTPKTTVDGKPPVEVVVSAPTKLVTTDEGESTLKTGDGIVPDFKDPEDNVLEKPAENFEEKRKRLKKKGNKRGLRFLIKDKVQSDMDRKMRMKAEKFQKDKAEGKIAVEELSPAGEPIVESSDIEMLIAKENDRLTETNQEIKDAVSKIPKSELDTFDKLYEGREEDDPRDK